MSANVRKCLNELSHMLHVIDFPFLMKKIAFKLYNANFAGKVGRLRQGMGGMSVNEYWNLYANDADEVEQLR